MAEIHKERQSATWRIASIMAPEPGASVMLVNVIAEMSRQSLHGSMEIFSACQFDVWIPATCRSLDEIEAQAFAQLRADWVVLTASLPPALT